MVKQTKVQLGNSTRTTIPKFIADHFELEDGDKVEWDLVTKGTHAGKAFIKKAEEFDQE